MRPRSDRREVRFSGSVSSLRALLWRYVARASSRRICMKTLAALSLAPKPCISLRPLSINLPAR